MKKNFAVKLFTAISSLSMFSPAMNSVNAVLPIDLNYTEFRKDEKRQNGYVCSFDRFCSLCKIEGQTYDEKLESLKEMLEEDFIEFGVCLSYSFDRLFGLCKVKGETHDEKLKEVEEKLGKDFMNLKIYSDVDVEGKIVLRYLRGDHFQSNMYDFVSAKVVDSSCGHWSQGYYRGFVIVSLTLEEYEAIKDNLKFGTEKVEKMLTNNSIKINVDKKE